MFRRLKAAFESGLGGGKLRRVLVVALLLAFTVQMQLAASHFHLAAAAASSSADNAPAKAPKKAPAPDDCPICQQLSSVHAALIYVAVALSLPDIIAAKAIAPPDERAPVPLMARNWQSRAPPL